MAERARVREIDDDEGRRLPSQAADRIVTDLKVLQQPGPRAVGFPPGEPLVDRLPRPIARRQVPLRSPGPQTPQHSVDHLPVVPPRPPSTTQRRQERSCPLPRRIRQLAMPMNETERSVRWKGPECGM